MKFGIELPTTLYHCLSCGMYGETWEQFKTEVPSSAFIGQAADTLLFKCPKCGETSSLNLNILDELRGRKA